MFYKFKLHYVHGAWAFLFLFMHSLLYPVFEYYVCIKSLIVDSCDAIVLFELQLQIPTTPGLWSYLCPKFHWYWWQGENLNPGTTTWLLLWLEIYSRGHHIIAFVYCTLLDINLVNICGISLSFSLGIFVDSSWNRRKLHSIAS